MVKRSLCMLIVIVMIGIMFSSCTSKKEVVMEKFDPNEEVTIKVMFMDEDYFYYKYGNLFISKYPNVNIEVLSTYLLYNDPLLSYEEAFRKLVDEQQPDVLLINSFQFEEMAQNGELYDLSGIIREDQFDLDGILPSIIELLKEKGSGNLYGLTPSFMSDALFYNIDLFNQHGIELPRNGMTWEELYLLANAFPKDGNEDDRIYGLYRNNSSRHFAWVSKEANTFGEFYVNPEEGKVMFDTEVWMKSYEHYVNAIKSGSLYIDRDFLHVGTIDDFIKRDLFLKGRAAMTFQNPNQLSMLQRATEFAEDYEPFQWGVVSVPVNPLDPKIEITILDIFAINAKSNNLRAAWELVKYINSEEMARIQGKTLGGSLLTRIEFMNKSIVQDISAFYAYPPYIDYSKPYEELPDGFNSQFIEIVERETEAVLANEKTIEEAIRTIQEDGQKAYDQTLAEQKDAEESAP